MASVEEGKLGQIDSVTFSNLLSGLKTYNDGKVALSSLMLLAQMDFLADFEKPAQKQKNVDKGIIKLIGRGGERKVVIIENGRFSYTGKEGINNSERK